MAEVLRNTVSCPKPPLPALVHDHLETVPKLKRLGCRLSELPDADHFLLLSLP